MHDSLVPPMTSPFTLSHQTSGSDFLWIALTWRLQWCGYLKPLLWRSTSWRCITPPCGMQQRKNIRLHFVFERGGIISKCPLVAFTGWACHKWQLRKPQCLYDRNMITYWWHGSPKSCSAEVYISMHTCKITLMLPPIRKLPVRGVFVPNTEYRYTQNTSIQSIGTNPSEWVFLSNLPNSREVRNTSLWPALPWGSVGLVFYLIRKMVARSWQSPFFLANKKERQ